jgi:hypothetical protein
VTTLIKGDGSHGAKEVSPSRPSSIAREGAFTLPPEPVRATPPPPKIARTRRHELGCGETRVSGVSPEPGGVATFGSRESRACPANEPRAAEPVGRPRKRAPNIARAGEDTSAERAVAAGHRSGGGGTGSLSLSRAPAAAAPPAGRVHGWHARNRP